MTEAEAIEVPNELLLNAPFPGTSHEEVLREFGP
jgi:hypothetical protein